jgi:hypothetical protein
MEETQNIMFEDILNNGMDGKYTDSCFWISFFQGLLIETRYGEFDNICEELTYNGVTIDTPYKLRNAFGFPQVSGPVDLWEQSHYEAIDRACRHFNVVIHIHTFSEKRDRNGNKYIKNNSDQFIPLDFDFLPKAKMNISIVSYPAHFQYIHTATANTKNRIFPHDSIIVTNYCQGLTTNSVAIPIPRLTRTQSSVTPSIATTTQSSSFIDFATFLASKNVKGALDDDEFCALMSEFESLSIDPSEERRKKEEERERKDRERKEREDRERIEQELKNKEIINTKEEIKNISNEVKEKKARQEQLTKELQDIINIENQTDDDEVNLIICTTAIEEIEDAIVREQETMKKLSEKLIMLLNS